MFGVQPRQLALALPHEESLTREDFLAGPSNRDALAMIERWPDWPARLCVLAGPEGSGKSHLAAIWAQMAGARIVSARALNVAMVPGALATGALVVEDLAVGEIDERALFHLINLARQDEAFVLITARTAPAGWDIALRDLASRLRALPVVRIEPPDDVLVRALIVKLGADRQMNLDESLVNYLASRVERSFAAIRILMTELDEESLRRQRPITRHLAGDILRAHEQPDLF